jgi:hypothetical protein
MKSKILTLLCAIFGLNKLMLFMRMPELSEEQKNILVYLVPLNG